MNIVHFFDERTGSLSYLVHKGRIGVVIDPVLDYEPRSACTFTESCDRIAAAIEELGLTIPYVFETHAHADHMSGMAYFRKRYGAQGVIGAGIVNVQRVFAEIYGLGADFPADGSQFDILAEDGDEIDAGTFMLRALSTPGHTEACMVYQVEDAVFLGDTLFQPDYGTARCDFSNGSADALYDSIQRLYALPGDTRLFACHDYRPGNRPMHFESTVREQRETNVQLNQETSREEFVAMRRKRDAELDMPVLILPSIQINIRAGEVPEPDKNNRSFLKLPLNVFQGDPSK
ncbi:MAG TPA: MBL fold metallo-hydrolase [Myxococcales bacterium]|nr:MBL fold metallo-hydrolase [Myxococcales bacterium]